MSLILLLALLLYTPAAAAEPLTETPVQIEEFAEVVELADASGVEEEEEAGFRFTDMGWSKEEDNFYEYIPNEGVFERGNTVYGFMEVTGFENRYADGMYHIDLTVDVYLRTSFGLRLWVERDVIEFDDTDTELIDTVWFYLWVKIPWYAPRGTYIAEVVVRDRIANQQIIHRERIRVQ
ncbi:MAG TPA: hypothetical protein VJ064_05570 [Limnochordia bacterium]|nr:hypothetical protein [Limnochordia bacterium]